MHARTSSVRTACAIAALLAASVAPPAPAEVYTPVPTESVRADSLFPAIRDALGSSTRNLEGQCYQGQRELLAKMDQYRLDNPGVLESAGIAYGPVGNGAHMGMSIYYDDPGQDALTDMRESGVVFDHHNYWSNFDGEYELNSFSSWGGGKGKPITQRKEFSVEIDGERVFLYWNANGTGAGPLPSHPLLGRSAQRGPFGWEAEGRKTFEASSSYDPNAKVGPAGVGPERWVSGREPFEYDVLFENVGGAPAQVVVIDDQLDVDHLDPATFTFGDLRFGDTLVAIPPGTTALDELVDLRPAFVVRVLGSFDPGTGAVHWRFETLDPLTWEAPVFDGFLPPNLTPPEGQGAVTYRVAPRVGLADGATIGAARPASIVFDQNAPIATADWTNQVDAAPPTSEVLLGPVQPAAPFPVAWTSDDAAGSGVRDHTIWVSEDGAPFRVWIGYGQRDGDDFDGLPATYAFYAVARDRVGNVEAPPAPPVATLLLGPLDPFLGYVAKSHDRAADTLRKECTVALDDVRFDGAEHFTLSAVQQLLLPADDDGTGTSDPESHLVGYKLAPAKQGIGAPVGNAGREKFPKASKHMPRLGLVVRNRLGEVVLDTTKDALLLAPAAKSLASPPAADPGAVLDHYKCYGVKVAKVDSAQAPGGKFRKDLQAIVEDQFAGGSGHPVLGDARLYDLKKPLLFCNPVAKAPIDTTTTDGEGKARYTACPVLPADVVRVDDRLLCYQAKAAGAVRAADVATRLSVAMGASLVPAQAKTVARTPFVRTGLPAPGRVDTKNETMLCVPTTVE